MEFNPLGDRAVVELHATDEITSGGIIIPGAVQEVPTEGTVLKVGEGRTTEQGDLVPMVLKVGDHIMIDPGKVQPVVLNGQNLVIVKSDDVLGVYENV